MITYFFFKKKDVSDLNVFLSLANAVNRGPESVESLKVRIPTKCNGWHYII